MTRRPLFIISLLIAATLVTGVAVAATHEHASLIPPGAPAGYLQINPQTCRFVHPEIDVRPSSGERYARAEDARDDVKLKCLAQRGITGYTRVFAQGTGHTVTATCPTGDVVLGGGSSDEVTGSYPSTDFAWTVVRDHLSPRVLSAWAVCAKA